MNRKEFREKMKKVRRFFISSYCNRGHGQACCYSLFVIVGSRAVRAFELMYRAESPFSKESYWLGAPRVNANPLKLRITKPHGYREYKAAKIRRIEHLCKFERDMLKIRNVFKLWRL